MSCNSEKRYSIFLFLLMFLLLTFVTAGNSETLGPGWFIHQSEMTPEEVVNYYESKKEEAKQKLKKYSTKDIRKESFGKAKSRTFKSNHLHKQEGILVGNEIKQLARALQYNPKLIYDYVHNNIDYSPYYGLLKGPVRTLLDLEGNDFDQASLMVELLRESGYSAKYVFGVMTIPREQIIKWLALDLVNVTLSEEQKESIIINILGGTMGIPVYRPEISENRDIPIRRVWIKAKIDGMDVVFDPAFKRYEGNAWFSYLRQEMGYDRESFLNDVIEGAAIGSDFVQGLNEDLLRNKLNEYSGRLIDAVKTKFANESIRKIIGGASIVRSNMMQYKMKPDFPTVDVVEFNEIPQEFKGSIRIQHHGIDHSFFVPDIADKRLTMTYSKEDYSPELRLDGDLIERGDSMELGDSAYITIMFKSHEDSNCPLGAAYPIKSGFTYAIVSAFGSPPDGYINARQEVLSFNMQNNYSEKSEVIMGETLNIMGLTWLKEVMLNNEITQLLFNTISVPFLIGIMAQEEGYFIDIKHGLFNIASKIGGDHRLFSHGAALATSSALEHGVLEQMMGADNPGISTMKLFQISNAEGQKIFYADSNNFFSIRSKLLNYPDDQLDQFEQKIMDGYSLIIPENGSMELGSWHGYGVILKKEIYSDWSNLILKPGINLEFLIAGDHHGGYSSQKEQISPEVVSDTVEATNFEEDRDVSNETQKSNEPVDMTTGAYLFDHTDLALGGNVPLGLSFSRSYNSSNKLSQSGVGYGWTHNLDISIVNTSHGDPSLGKRTLMDAIPLIVVNYILENLYPSQDNAQGWVIISLIANWAIDQLIDNAVTVNMGSQAMEYIKLPGGTFSPPPGITTELIKNGDGTFSLKERFGTQFDFNENNQIAKIADIDGNEMTFTYTGDQLTEVTDAFGRHLTLHYTGDFLTSVTDSTGRGVSYEYDDSGDLVSFTDEEGNAWGYSYDDKHQMTSLTNPLDVVTAQNTYDSLGRVDTQTVPRQGTSATYNFYFSDFRNIEEDPYGQQTIYHLDKKGRTIAMENALGNKIQKKYDGQNHEIEIIDERNARTYYFYNENRDVKRIRSPERSGESRTDNFSYDQYYRIYYSDTSYWGGNKATSSWYEYDDKHHVTKVKDGEDNSVSHTYYPNGQLETTTDARGNTATFIYDSFGNPLSAKTGNHSPVTYEYDAIGRMLKLTDNEGAVSSFEYDKRGLLLSQTDPLGKTTFYIYDEAGRVTSYTDRKGRVTSYDYTPTGKLETVTYADTSTVSYTYNLHDKLTSMTDSLGTTIYEYDEVYRVKSVTDPHGFTIGYEYDEAGNISKLTYPDGKAVEYNYDRSGLLEESIPWFASAQTATFRHDILDNLRNVDHFNRVYSNYNVDQASRLTSIYHNMMINPAKTVRKKLQNVSPMSLFIGNPTIAAYSYTLDGNGNRIKTEQAEPLAPIVSAEDSAYTYNDKRNRLLSAGDDTFGYDDEGQLNDKNETTYMFDDAHRLIAIEGGQSVQYYYDGAGRRLKAIRNGIETRYIYDAGGNLLAEADEENNILKYYIYGESLLAMVTPDDEYYSYHFDGNGNTVAITDKNQRVVNAYTYEPFGTITNQRELIDQPFKFAGQYGIMHESNDLYYMRARYYDPEVGRFISEDPIGFEGGDVNLYAYVWNNPINWIDPSGLSAENAGMVDNSIVSAIIIGSLAIPGPDEVVVVPAALTGAAIAAGSIWFINEYGEPVKNWVLKRGHRKKKQSTGRLKGKKKEKHQKSHPSRGQTPRGKRKKIDHGDWYFR